LRAQLLIADWTSTFTESLPADHAPIVLGLDGHVHFSEWGSCPGAVQVAVSIANREIVGVTFKTKPRDTYERDAIEIAWDDHLNRPAAHALAVHEPVVDIGGQRVLVLLCHDAVNWSARSEAASGPYGWSGVIRRQYAELLRRPDAPAIAINLIHRLPRRRESAMVTSPCFQSAHATLARRHKIRVVAVAGTHSGCSARSFRGLHERLACDYRSLDVLVRVRSRTRLPPLGDRP
jgi:hypothetical protein